MIAFTYLLFMQFSTIFATKGEIDPWDCSVAAKYRLYFYCSHIVVYSPKIKKA